MTGDVRRGASRGEPHAGSLYQVCAPDKDCPARSALRGGAARRPESLPGWRALGAVAVRSRGWCGGGSGSLGRPSSHNSHVMGLWQRHVMGLLHDGDRHVMGLLHLGTLT
jgi:hypothetical protein